MAASSHSATRAPANTSRLGNPLLIPKKTTTSSLLLSSSLFGSKSTQLVATKSPNEGATTTRLTRTDSTSYSRSCSIENPTLVKQDEHFIETTSVSDDKKPSLLIQTKPTALKNSTLQGSLLPNSGSLRSSNLLQGGLTEQLKLTSSNSLVYFQPKREPSTLTKRDTHSLSHAQSSRPNTALTSSGSSKTNLRSSLLTNTSLTGPTKTSPLLSSPKLGGRVTSISLTSHIGTQKTTTKAQHSSTLTSVKPKASTHLASKSHGTLKPSGYASGKSLLQREQLGLKNNRDSKTAATKSSSKKQKLDNITVETDGPVITVKPITKRTEGAPEYDFSAQRPQSPEGPKFLPPELDAAVQSPPPPIIDTVGVKTTLINAVATSLLASPDFRSSRDTTRRALTRLGEKIARFDPEFVLKVALYTRCNLNIRTTANFLLALASNIPSCRPFLKKYYSSSIRLPSDWLEVAEIYQAFQDKSVNFGSLPTALRRVMAAKFTSFDEYQLGKYNKDTSKRKKKKKEKENKEKSKPQASSKPTPQVSIATTISDDSSDDDSVVHSDKESDEEIERLSFTLKQLVRKIHISEPVYYVMCLLGKRYPAETEDFRRSRLPGVWDQDRAGKRMKLATPETWETQVSTKGNKAKTWEDLIDHNKLPFMAMLRNIRNLILAQVSSKHHQWVVRKLNDERAVVNSRQFPFQFFSAYEVLSELEKIAKGEQPPTKPRPAKKGAKKPKTPKELPKIDIGLLQRYRTALDSALKIATCYNVKPISGSTLILCNVGANMDRPCTSARGLGKPKTVMEVGILLGLMCKYSCEKCTMIVYGGNHFAEVQLKDGTILDNMANAKDTATQEGVTGQDGSIPIKFLTNKLIDRDQLDNIVVLTDEMKLDDQQGQDVIDFLSKYRHLVNPNLLFVSVDLSSKTRGVNSTIKPSHPNDIYLAGYSDQILRFIAERGDSGQITYIENIDKAYNLDSIKAPSLADVSNSPLSLAPEKSLLATTQKRWRTARVFISSTFRDMHGERDMLTRFVFPELRARAHSKQINIYEVDLRWGVTEEDARSHRAMEICLSEISRSQYFIGLLGQRYGWVQDQYMIPDSAEFDWLKEFPAGRSITEVEMNHAALRDTDKAVGKAFFYFRDPIALEKIPEAQKKNFESESHSALQKIENLKSQIRISGLEVYDGYPCQWLGMVEDKPLVGHLEDFGQRVLYNIWNAIQRDYPEDDAGQDPLTQANSFHEGFIENRATNFVGRRALLKKAQEALTGESGKLIIVAGKPGSGKSAFMAAIAQQYIESSACPSSNLLLPHFIGAAPDSTNVASILTRFCHEMKRRFGFNFDIPEDYSDLAKEWPEFLQESTNVIGTGSKLVVLIDGSDLLEDKQNGRSMDWIPDKIPNGVTVLISGVENGVCISNLRKRNPPPEEIIIGSLDIMDKAEMVRRKLAKHRKALEESPFNNQMKLLLTKKEANNPLYLHLACEELRVFGIFEEVTTFLKNMPPSISNLLQEILGRLETEHTLDVVSTAMSLLSLVRNGLMEHELSGVLAMYFEAQSVDGGSTLPPMVISRLLRSLQSFLQPSGQENTSILTLAHKDIEKAVRQRYMRGAASSKEKEFHRLLARYYKNEADPLSDGTYKGNSIRAFGELPHHLIMAGEWTQLENMLCNIHFLVTKCQLGLVQQLLEDYTPSASILPPGKSKDLARFVQQGRVLEFKSFVSRNLHVLVNSPTLTLQQAVNEPSSSLVSKAALGIIKEYPQPLMTCVNKPETTNPCVMSISGQGGTPTCIAISNDSRYFVAGFKNCAVKVFEIQTSKEIHSFVGHAASITSVCFVGSSSVCSGSKDNTLSLWDMQKGIRTAVLKAHSRPVQGCSANASGDRIASVSWDTTIKVWNGKNGKILNTLKTSGQHNTPINCVSFHPEGQVIAVGSWDSTVKIWDTLNQKRIKVIKGHKSSVQACSYAPSGRHLISASLDGEVKIWSTKYGVAVGSLVGHSFPVNSIAYTPNGQYLLTASSDKLIKVWSGSLGKPVRSMGSPEHGVIHCMTFDHSTQSIITGYHHGYVRKFNAHTGREIFAAKQHTAAVVGVAYHQPYFMSASMDTTVKIWTEANGPNKFLPLLGHKSPITCATWDKNGFATASEDLQIIIWPYTPKDYNNSFMVKKVTSQLPTKKSKSKASKQIDHTIIPLAILHAHTAKITSIAFSCNKLKMVTASNDKTLIIWDTFSYKQLQVLNACHKDWINTCAFSTDYPDLLVTGSNDFTLKLWDLKTGTEKTTLKGHTSSINSVSFYRDCIVSAGFDGSVKVWTSKGIEITTMYCHKQRINSCLVNIPSKSPGASFDWADAVADDDAKPKVKLSEITLMTASDDGTIGVWKPFLPNEITSLIGHSDRVLSIATTVNNEVLSSSLDGSIRLWRPQLSDEPHKLTRISQEQGHTGEVMCCDTVFISNQESYAVTSGRDGNFIIWHITSRDGQTSSEKLYTVAATDKAITSVCFVSFLEKTQQGTIVIGKDDGVMVTYKFTPNEYPSSTASVTSGALMGPHPISKLVLTPDRNSILAGSWSNQIAAVANNSRVRTRMETHKGWVMDMVAFENAGQTVLYSIGLDNQLCRWDIPYVKPGPARLPTSTSTATKFNIDLGSDRDKAWPLAMLKLDNLPFLAISDSEGVLYVWSLSAKQVIMKRKVHKTAINALASTPSGEIVTGSNDGTVKVWGVNGRGTEVTQIGQFYCQSSVVSIATIGSKSQGGKNVDPMFVVGDTLGHVTLIRWTQ